MAVSSKFDVFQGAWIGMHTACAEGTLERNNIKFTCLKYRIIYYTIQKNLNTECSLKCNINLAKNPELEYT